MAKKQALKQKSGGARLLASGRRPVALALDPQQNERARRAADLDGRSLANLALVSLMRAVDRILADPPT